MVVFKMPLGNLQAAPADKIEEDFLTDFLNTAQFHIPGPTTSAN